VARLNVLVLVLSRYLGLVWFRLVCLCMCTYVRDYFITGPWAVV
jgi:hypothetical protein